VSAATTDRALQDDVIRALADAPYRASAEWRSRRLADPDRVERYARFLARHFYFERIVQFFKYSRVLAMVTGRRPEAVLRTAAFDAILPTLVLGSGETAAEVARLVTAHIAGGGDGRVPYLGDLLRYEEAMMVAEAGPRVWRDDARELGSREQDRPETVSGTVLLQLSFDLPTVLPRLLQRWTEVPQAPERPTQLLVARSPHGRVAVARGDESLAALIGLADGTRTIQELAAHTGLEVGTLHETLRGLVELGALRFSTGS
jgi:IclR helix-turn-helix domain